MAGRTIAYHYDALGRLTERRINGADPTVYTYDTANRIKTIAYRHHTVTYAYDPGGRLTSRTLPNGLVQTYTYNAVNELTHIVYKKPDGTVMDTLTYDYDPLGNPIERRRTGTGSQQDTGFTATYDAHNRLLTYNGQALTYDANGNLIQRQTPQGPITYTWNARNQLTAVQGPNGSAAFTYDALGRRIEKTLNGITTRYLYDGQQAIAELQGSTVGTTYLTGLEIDEVLAIYANQGNRTTLTDALGSILALADEQQAITTRYAYSPFGETDEQGETSDNPYQYTGRENDENGLYFYRARYYDPQLKRFISSDPIGLRGGLNTYAYVNNNPLRFTDPLGLLGNCGMPGGSCATPKTIADDYDAGCLLQCVTDNAAICGAFSLGASGLGATVGGIAGILGGGVAVAAGAEIGSTVGGLSGLGICKIAIAKSCTKICKKEKPQCQKPAEAAETE